MKCYPEQLLEKEDSESYQSYFNRLYDVFKEEILNKLSYNGLPIMIKEFPPEGGDKEEGFYHLTTTDYERGLNYRQPDFNRSKRLSLIKPIIENYKKCPICVDDSCSGIYLWSEPFKNNKTRIYFLLQEMNYIIVLEKRTGYYLLVTAFYVKPQNMESYFKRYEEYSQ